MKVDLKLQTLANFVFFQNQLINCLGWFYVKDAPLDSKISGGGRKLGSEKSVCFLSPKAASFFVLFFKLHAYIYCKLGGVYFLVFVGI